MNELMVREFGTKEVRWSNDDKVNLVDVAKCLGLTRKKDNKNYIRWTGNSNSVVEKLEKILSAPNGAPIENREEIKNVLEEIEGAEDRSTIFISNWLAKRLATECHSDIAHEFKNWLVSLDCAREEIEKQTGATLQDLLNIQQQVNTISQLMNKTVDTVVSIVGQQTEVVNKQGDIINQQAEEYKKDREELKEFIGLRAKQVRELSHQLMVKVCSAYGKKIYASSYAWEINRDKLLNDNGYYKWEDIPVSEFENMKRKIMDFKIIILKEENKKEEKIKETIEDFTDYKPSEKRIRKIETKVIDGIVYQKCTTCGKWKPQNKDNFYRDKRNSRGFKSQCKECKIGYYITNRETRLEHQKDYAKKIKPDLERKELKYNSKYSNLKDDK